LKLLAVDEARARMLARTPLTDLEAAALAGATGRVLAEDVAARRDQPPFPASAMDGWAVRSSDTPGTLRIVGESAAGAGYSGAVGAGEAVRIFTGAAVPQGCDAIVIQEDAERRDGEVVVPAVAAGTYVRPAGGDFRAGDRLITTGTRLDAWRLALAASAGRADVVVHAKPSVAIIATGEEIVTPPDEPGPFQIYDSAAPGLVAMARGWGADVRTLRPVRDDLDAVVEALRSAPADLIVTIGGASVGDHDLVRAAGEALGLVLDVASVNVRPGRPTFFGVLDDGRRLLGLPGNPASAFVCAELFLRPILAKAQGQTWTAPAITARLSEDLPANGPREHWMRAKLTYAEGGVTVLPWRDQDSSLVTVFAAADALLKRAAGAPAAVAGEVVEVWPLARAS
jgi:molybdopterin molybdotransferase